MRDTAAGPPGHTALPVTLVDPVAKRLPGLKVKLLPRVSRWTSRMAAMVVGGLAFGLLAAGCSGPSKPAGTAAPAASASDASAGAAAQSPGPGQPSGQAPVPAESNPPGDIPDNTAFVAYHSTGGGFQVKVPEGWGRTDSTAGVTFADRLNTIAVTWQAAPTAPSIDRAKAQDVPQLQRTQPAFQLGKLSAVTLPAGPAVFIEAQENSQPNAVTGKQYRLDVQRYELFHNGQQAVLLLSAPVGSDNVDAWRTVAESFQWR